MREPRLRTPNANPDPNPHPNPNRNGQCPRTSNTPAEAADEADRLGQVVLGLGAVLRVVLVPEISGRSAGDQWEISVEGVLASECVARRRQGPVGSAGSGLP